MKYLKLLYFTLSLNISLVTAFIPSAGNCGPSSVDNVPGCWGQPGCAYVIAEDLGSGALCKFNYCDCGGTVVPLLPLTVSGSTTIGCDSYTIQPSTNECPTTSATVSAPIGTVLVTGIINGTKITETYEPTIYSQFANLTATITTILIAASRKPTTVTVGPSGVAWMPLNPNTALPNVPPPSDLPSNSDNDELSGSTVVTVIAGSQSSYIVLTLPSGSSLIGGQTLITGGSTLTIQPSSAVDTASEFSGGVIVDSSTFDRPSETETITKADGSTLVIVPSGIVIGSSTIPFQSEPTTMTSEGVELTFGGAVNTARTSTKSTSFVSLVGSASSATDTPAITPPPSGSIGALPDTVPTSHTRDSLIAVTLDGVTYVLPYTVSIELLQSDGTQLTLFSNSIISGSATATIPPSQSQTHISVGDLSIEAGPGFSGLLVGGGAIGFDGLINALKKLSGSANSIVNTLDLIGHQGVSWSSNGLTNLEFASGVEGLMDSATSGLADFASTLNSVINDFNPETYELTEDGLRRIFPARLGAVEELDILSSLKKLVRGITGLRNNVILNMKDYWKQGAAIAAALAVTEEALRNFGAYDWDLERRSHTSSTSSTTNSTFTLTFTETSSSSSSSDTAAPTPYYFVTKTGTEMGKFKSYIKGLPDQGNGYQMTFPGVPWQGYMTNLTKAQAKAVAKKDFVSFVSLITEFDSDEAGIIPQSHKIQKRLFGRKSLKERKKSFNHLRSVSVPDQKNLKGDLPNYLYDPKLGKGQTIYILDSGFNINHVEFSTKNGRTVRTKVVPNQLTLALTLEKNWSAEDITDISNHGTGVASVAGGIKHGIASRANLVLVKIKNSAKSEYTGNTVPHGMTGPALFYAWSWTISDIKSRRNEGNKGKSIINLSGGYKDVLNVPGQISDARLIMKQVLDECWAQDIITVVAAGNEGEKGGSLDLASPQYYGTVDNALITVGGVDIDGVLAQLTTFDAGRGGSLTVYAVSSDVDVANSGDDESSMKTIGTSFGAPAVAGLAAYFASLPSLDGEWTQGQVAKQMKDYIVRHAYVRSANPIPQDLKPWYNPPPEPESIKVIYNRAPEGLCAKKAPAKRSITRRDDYSDDVYVLFEGTVLDPLLPFQYCPAQTASFISTTTSYSATTDGTAISSSSFSLTNLPTLPPASYCTEFLSNGEQILHTKTASSCTYDTVQPTTSTASTASPAASAIYTDQGLLYCGTRTDRDNAQYWFTSGDAEAAIRVFCSNMTSADPPIVFKPGSDEKRYGIWEQPDNVKSTIRVSAAWNKVGDSGCPTWDFSDNEDLKSYKECQIRLNHPLNDCDIKSYDTEFWKQGGRFYKDCISWEITSNYTAFD